MKNLVFILLFVSLKSFSQSTECDGTRFKDSLFAVTVTSNVLYGHNTNYDGSGRDLKMDIYQPVGDVATKRPLIIFAPKGSFLSENKAELTMVQLCTHFASLGYVAASIDYRVGLNYMSVLQNAEKEFTLAVLRAAHDYKAAIRFFRKDAYTTNTYRIDTNLIVAGGSSAGAITAVHVAYLNKPEEIPTSFDTTGLGGPEGLSGNPGYSSRPHFVVNLCGAIADTIWMEQNDLPIISMHGNLDTEVPYGTAVVSMFGFPIMEIDGSASIKKRADNVGIDNPFYTFWGKTHIPYDENAGGSYLLYMDTVKQYITPILYDWICQTTSSNEISEEKSNFSIYPNPANDFLNINALNNSDYTISIINNMGVEIYKKQISETGLQTIDIKSLHRGIYFVKTQNNTHHSVNKIIKN